MPHRPTLHQQNRKICIGASPIDRTGCRTDGRNRGTNSAPSRCLILPARSSIPTGSLTSFPSSTSSATCWSATARSGCGSVRSRSPSASPTQAHRRSRCRRHPCPLADREALARQPWRQPGRGDASRIRTDPGVFARLRSFAFDILKPDRTGILTQDRSRVAGGRINKLLKMRRIR